MKATDTLTFLDGLGNHHPQRWYAEFTSFASDEKPHKTGHFRDA